MSAPLPASPHPDFTGLAVSELLPESFPGPEEVHVWLIPVTPGLREGLSEAEKSQASRFHQPSDADRYSSARIALRRLAGAYLGLAPSAVHITGARHEKPGIENPGGFSFHFNSTHSGNIALIAFSAVPVGIDIEQTATGFGFHELLPTQFSEPEREAIAVAPDQVAAFYLLWTRKEALTKGWGTGLQEDLIRVPVLTDVSATIKTGNWQLRSFTPEPGYTAALAVKGRETHTRFYREI